MKIYIAHSSGFDFEKELYEPIRKSSLNNIAQIILPHENISNNTAQKTSESSRDINSAIFNSKDELKSVDYVIAETTFPSTGLGIELGWANMYGVKIIAFHRKGSKISSSIKAVTNEIYEYSSAEDLVEQIARVCK